MSTSTPAAAHDSAVMAPSDTNALNQHPDSRKRVRRACEYCRRKRLKCTADQRPCLNCQLYGAECVSVPEVSGVRKRRRRANITRHAANIDALACNELLEPSRDPLRPREDGDGDGDGNEDGDADGDGEVESIHVATTATGVTQDDPSDLFTDPAAASLSAFEQVISDVGIDLTHEFWGFDSFINGCNPPDEHAAAEQLLALQSPPETEVAASSRPPASLRPSGAKGSVGKIFGVEELASQPMSSLGAMSSGIFHRKDKGNSQFLGFTSTAAVLALCVRESTDAHHRLADSESLRFIVDCGPMCDEISCPDVKDMPSQQIPSTTLAAQCVDTFFEDYHASHPIADRSHVGLILERYVSQGHRGLSPLEQSVLYLITALGASSRPVMSSSKSVNSENLYALAWSLFSQAVAAPSPVSVQILLLHVLYNIHCSKWSIAWVLCGLAVRVAQSVGLHMVSPQDFGLEYGQSRLRARLWAVAMILDAHLSMSQGRPSACQPSQCDTELVSNKCGLLHVPELRWPLSEVLTWRVSLAQIQQRLNKAFSSVITTEQRLSCLEQLDLSLMRWKEELPFEFRPEQQTILDGNAHIDIYMLHLDYLNLLQTIHWCLINHRTEASIREYVAPRLRASESICLGACLALVRTLNAMTDGDTRARSFRSRSDHFLSAMAIVYRDITRNPGKVSARTNLEYLRVIKLHLSRMGDEHLLAASLTKLFENMVKTAEELVREHSNVAM